jgi:putative membrane protein
MAKHKLSISLTAMTLACIATACGDSASNPPPKAPSDVTTTTAAPATDPPSLAMAGPGAPVGGYPNAGPDPSGAQSSSGTSSSLNATAGTSAMTPNGGPAAGGSDTSSPALKDGEIVAVVQTADHGEIDQAREALRKGKNGRVKQFAQHMITDHTAAETKLASLDSKAGITPTENAVTAQLKTGGEQIMGTLKSSTGSDFDKAYIDAQVNEHTQVLDLLDNKLIPHAQNADLTKTLQDVRTKVAGHLKMAQEIQSALAQAK